MPKRILLTPEAARNLSNIIGYLIQEWGVKVCSSFVTKFDGVCNRIAAAPANYPIVYEKENVRKCVLDKKNIIFFRISADVVEILAIFDTRQDPEKIKQLF